MIDFVVPDVVVDVHGTHRVRLPREAERDTGVVSRNAQSRDRVVVNVKVTAERLEIPDKDRPVAVAASLSVVRRSFCRIVEEHIPIDGPVGRLIPSAPTRGRNRCGTHAVFEVVIADIQVCGGAAVVVLEIEHGGVPCVGVTVILAPVVLDRSV